jgi:hypothetical protein
MTCGYWKNDEDVRTNDLMIDKSGAISRYRGKS